MGIIIKENFNPQEFGWVSEKTPPTNHNQVVVLVWLQDETLYKEVLGFYESGDWSLYNIEDENFEIQGWFPYPYTPHNH
jgi:hypothetical protein